MRRFVVTIAAVLVTVASMAQLYAFSMNGKAQIQREGETREVFVADILHEDDLLTTEEYGHIVILDRNRNKKYSLQSPVPQPIRSLIASQGANARTLPGEYIQHLYVHLVGYDSADTAAQQDTGGITYRSENIDLIIAQTLTQAPITQTVDFLLLDQHTLQPVYHLVEGQSVVLQLENHSDNPLYVNIIDRDPAGGTFVLLPVNPLDSLSDVYLPPHSKIRLNTNPISFAPGGTSDELTLIAYSEPFNISRVIRRPAVGGKSERTGYVNTKKIDIHTAHDCDHPDYAFSLNNLGLLYSEQGDFSKAEQYYLQSSGIYKNTLGENHPNYASSLNNLGNLYRNIGDYPKAEQYYLHSLTLLESISGSNHPDYASALNNLGNLYRNIGDYEKAEQYYLPSLEILKAAFGEDHPDYAALLNNLGLLYTDLEDYPKAEQYYLQSSGIYKNALGENHPKYAISLNNLGNLYRAIGDSSRAERCYLHSLAILKTSYGEDHPDYASSLHDIGRLYYNFRDYPKAEQYLLRSQEISRSGFLKSLDYMSEQQRHSYWSTIKKRYESTYPDFSYRFFSTNPSISGFAYNNELFTKGLLLNSSSAIRLSIAESGDTTLIRQWNELTVRKQQIMALEEKNPQLPRLSALREEAEQLEKEIIRSSAAYRENIRQWNITWDSIKAVLKPNQVAIEYMRAPLNDDSTMYCALLLRDTCSCPIMIPLFEEKEVNRLLHQTTGNKENIDTTYADNQNGKQLAQLVWSKVLPYINEGEVVFFAPTGVLHQVAIEHLPFTESCTTGDMYNTVGDKYNLVRLSSTRELAIYRPAVPHQSATLYGGILYEPMDNDVLLANTAKYRSLQSTEQHTSSMDTTRRSIADYLPGSKAEVDSIRPILEKKDIAVTVYSKDTAYEESFKALSGKQPNILLLSTHGFFWQDSTAKQERYFSKRGMPSIDPLERCGLLFAGANTALSGHSERLPKGVNDGILTAKEISVLDFRNTDIVVLSACETGLGDISGEGVFGLQRAFKMAGTKTIMMTLWQVNDRATNLFMTSFFRHYSQGMSKRQAFRRAQHEVRNYSGDALSSDSKAIISGKEKMLNKGKMTESQQKPVTGSLPSSVSNQKSELTHPYASPYYWAGFILLD